MSLAALILPLRISSTACLTDDRSAVVVVVETGAATGASDRAGWVSALASVMAGRSPSGRGRGRGAREAADAGADFLPADCLPPECLPALAAVLAAPLAPGFLAAAFAVSFFAASLLVDGFFVADCFFWSASDGFGAAARWPLSAIRDAKARASGSARAFLTAGIWILFPLGAPRNKAGAGFPKPLGGRTLVGGFPPVPVYEP